MRRSDEARQLKLQEALERRRIRMQYEAKYDLEPQAPTPFGAPVQRGPGNWVQQTKVPTRAQFDEENRIIQPSLMQDGPEYTVPDPYALDPKDAAMMEFRRDKAEMDAENYRERTEMYRSRPSGSGGSGAAPKTRTVYDRETGEAVQQEWTNGNWVEVGRGPRWKTDDANNDAPSRKPTPTERLTAVKGLKEFSTELTKTQGVENILALAESYGAPVAGVEMGKWTEPGKIFGEFSPNERQGPMYNGKPLDENTARKLVRERVAPLFDVDTPSDKGGDKGGAKSGGTQPVPEELKGKAPGTVVADAQGNEWVILPNGQMEPKR